MNQLQPAAHDSLALPIRLPLATFEMSQSRLHRQVGVAAWFVSVLIWLSHPVSSWSVPCPFLQASHFIQPCCSHLSSHRGFLFVHSDRLTEWAFAHHTRHFIPTDTSKKKKKQKTKCHVHAAAPGGPAGTLEQDVRGVHCCFDSCLSKRQELGRAKVS